MVLTLDTVFNGIDDQDINDPDINSQFTCLWTTVLFYLISKGSAENTHWKKRDHLQ